ncbi:putative HTH-type transcriptional regulator [Ephemeroptericola cinctiostellae]|uniref:Putative HTH-type transcriptional regulator n=1 Tax=Ephemeroptericola cinctiostellae TaxID=2268024 RepID=A0A345DAU6_9BURK|nr:LysR family transcriptional regulator ArgP [Ephemeroptericola cinctiostellae]AXF85484.1 putative HTH-type transcriptional regulator [Ephemeroptericola cinctiostellae]
MLESELLATVATVVREGSFERAAAILNITPSAVSQRVRLLEERVGVVLVVRGQPCTATQAGERVCRHADTVALLEGDLRRDMPTLLPEVKHRMHSTMRIAINADSLSSWFIHAMQLFSKQNDTLLDIALDDQEKTSEWLKRGQVLAAVSAERTAIQGCRSHKLGSLRYVATASPEFVARHFTLGLNADSLMRAPSLIFDRNDQLQQQWVRKLTRKNIVLPAHRLPSPQAFIDATSAGVGWGMNLLSAVQNQLQSGQLIALDNSRTLDIPLYWQVSKLPLPSLQSLTRCVLEASHAALIS